MGYIPIIAFVSFISFATSSKGDAIFMSQCNANVVIFEENLDLFLKVTDSFKCGPLKNNDIFKVISKNKYFENDKEYTVEYGTASSIDNSNNKWLQWFSKSNNDTFISTEKEPLKKDI